jgi:hypothetical protein
MEVISSSCEINDNGKKGNVLVVVTAYHDIEQSIAMVDAD